jgi:imidazolonepropionase
LIRGARQLLTLRGPVGIRRGAFLQDLGIIEDGAVLIRNGVIQHVGPSRRVENLRESQGAFVISANGRVVMPGLVDSNLRLMVSDAITLKRVGVAKTLAEAKAVLRGSLYHGTTQAEIRAGGSSPESEYRALRHSAKLGSAGGNIVRSWLISPDANATPQNAISSRLPFIEQISKRRLAKFVEVEIRPEQAAIAAGIFEMAAKHGLGCKLGWRGPSSPAMVELASRFRTQTISHLTSLDNRSREALLQLPTLLSVVPGRELIEGDYDPIGTCGFVKEGGAISIGSGYDRIHSPGFNLQMAIALAVMRLRLTPEEAISSATINAAHASGAASECGSLEAGKRADLLLLNLNDYRELPRQFGINHVGMVIQGGAVVFNHTSLKVAKAQAHSSTHR